MASGYVSDASQVWEASQVSQGLWGDGIKIAIDLCKINFKFKCRWRFAK